MNLIGDISRKVFLGFLFFGSLRALKRPKASPVQGEELGDTEEETLDCMEELASRLEP